MIKKLLETIVIFYSESAGYLACRRPPRIAGCQTQEHKEGETPSSSSTLIDDRLVKGCTEICQILCTFSACLSSHCTVPRFNEILCTV